MGGWPNNISTFETYNPSANVWSTLTPLSLGRQQTNGSASYNGKLYFVGGKNSSISKFYKECDSFYPSTNSWSIISSLPQSTYGGAIAIDSAKGILHYSGGVTIPNYSNLYISGQTNSHYIYNIASDQWSSATSLPVKRSGHVSAFVNGKLFVFGGFDSVGVIKNTVYSLY